jgi:hypothetical protein
MDTEPVLRYWTLHSPNGEVATCELVRTPKGLEVRCDWSGEGTQARVARAAAIQAIAEALHVAETWKAWYVAKGWMARASGPAN